MNVENGNKTKIVVADNDRNLKAYQFLVVIKNDVNGARGNYKLPIRNIAVIFLSCWHVFLSSDKKVSDTTQGRSPL